MSIGVTLSEVCFDQLNLENNCAKALEMHEEKLSQDVMLNNRSFDSVLAEMKSFCRIYASKGFYDPHGRLESIVRAWYECLQEIKQYQFEETEKQKMNN